MPSFQDSAVIFFLALLLFGPKKLPELARQLGKLMGEFRRASADFRFQMEDELRVSEQTERNKQIAALEAAAPATPALSTAEPGQPSLELGQPSPGPVNEHDEPFTHPHLPDYQAEPIAAPLPIATSGDLSLMPPSTGLPVASSASLFGSLPHTPEPDPTPAQPPLILQLPEATSFGGEFASELHRNAPNTIGPPHSGAPASIPDSAQTASVESHTHG